MANDSVKLNMTVVVFYIGFFLLLLAAAIVVTTSLFFFAGISISAANTVIGLAIAIASIFLIKALDLRKKLVIILSGIFIFILCLIGSSAVYDTTWDGSAYHKQAIGLLKDGWNPYAFPAQAYAELSQSVPELRESPLLWAESYPKATWYYSASLYALTDNIESGKSYNPLFAVITFCFFFGLLSEMTSAPKRSSLIALITALNPIAMSQMQSYYLDGLVADAIMLMVLVLFALVCDYSKKAIGITSRTGLYAVLVMLLFLACNCKFSVLLFAATICGLYFLWYCVFHKRFATRHLSVQRLFAFFTATVLFSVCVVGCAPYLTNTVRYHNPLYSFVKSDGEIMFNDSVITSAGGLAELNWQQNFFASLFGKMSHGEYTTLGELLKVPFTFSIGELNYYFYVDTRLSGMGIFFSGIFLIALAVLIIRCVCLLKKRENLTPPAVFICLLIVVLLVEIILLPASMQFRYIGFIYLIPILALSICIYGYNEQNKGIAVKIGAVVLSLALIANSLPWFLPIVMRIREGARITAQLKSFSQSALNSEGTVTVAIDHPDLTGYYYNLRDFGITGYDVADIDRVNSEWFSAYSNFKRDLIHYKLES